VEPGADAAGEESLMGTVEWLVKVSPKWVGSWVNSQAARAVVSTPMPVEGRRSTAARLEARLTRADEALSPRALRALLDEMKSVVDVGVSEVEGGRRAQKLAEWFERASDGERQDFALLMSEQFAMDVRRIESARQALESALGASQAGEGAASAAEVKLRRALQTPRRRLLKRFSAFPQGIRFLVDLRAQVLGWLRQDPRLAALDGELEILLSTWFDVGFLELRQLSWDSPASLLEKLIRYEAVHDIRSWSDLKNRLDSDRRCYAFFHPRLPSEPLIFVEVAFTDHLADNVAALLDEAAPKVDQTKASTAIFYSISNTQPGLKGVSFGDSLLKHVVEALRQEFPKLRHFATLSPIPGLRMWLRQALAEQVAQLPARRVQALREAALRIVGTADAAVRSDAATKPHPVDGEVHQGGLSPADAAGASDVALDVLLSRAFEQAHTLPPQDPVALYLKHLTARYLVHTLDHGLPLDPVARFHLGNGARVERIHHAADLSAKGLKRAYGLMVNYLYDIKRLDKHRAQLASGQVPASREVEDLCAD